MFHRSFRRLLFATRPAGLHAAVMGRPLNLFELRAKARDRVLKRIQGRPFKSFEDCEQVHAHP